MMDTSLFFDTFSKNAESNAILVMDPEGQILQINAAFTNHYGYKDEDIRGRNFSLLFTMRDRQKHKPALELETILAKGQALNENYIMHKKGVALWSTGEAILVTGEQGAKYIVKDIVNLQSKRQLQMLLTESEVLLERMFNQEEDMPLMVLDGSLKILRVNETFVRFFSLGHPPPVGSSISEILHPLWSKEAFRKEIIQMLVGSQAINDKEFTWQEGDVDKTICMNSKIIDRPSAGGKTIYIMAEPVG